MAKVKYHGEGRYAFWCPGCGHDHVYYTMPPHPNGSAWQFNGDINNPTFTPSLLNRWGKEADPNWQLPEDHETHSPKHGWSGRCHLFVVNGVINYCGDCTHDHNGMQNVAMKEYT